MSNLLTTTKRLCLRNERYLSNFFIYMYSESGGENSEREDRNIISTNKEFRLSQFSSHQKKMSSPCQVECTLFAL